MQSCIPEQCLVGPPIVRIQHVTSVQCMAMQLQWVYDVFLLHLKHCSLEAKQKCIHDVSDVCMTAGTYFNSQHHSINFMSASSVVEHVDGRKR